MAISIIKITIKYEYLIKAYDIYNKETIINKELVIMRCNNS